MPANQKLFIAVTSPYSATSIWRLRDGSYQRREHGLGCGTQKYEADAHEAARVIVDTLDIDRKRGDRCHSALRGKPFADVFAALLKGEFNRELVD